MRGNRFDPLCDADGSQSGLCLAQACAAPLARVVADEPRAERTPPPPASLTGWDRRGRRLVASKGKRPPGFQAGDRADARDLKGRDS